MNTSLRFLKNYSQNLEMIKVLSGSTPDSLSMLRLLILRS